MEIVLWIIVPRLLHKENYKKYQVLQLSKTPPSKADVDASVADYKGKEAKVVGAALAHSQAQSRHGKAVAKKHKEGSPMPDEEQKAEMKKIDKLLGEKKRLTQEAVASRGRSDRMHNDYRAANLSSQNTDRFGGAQKALHQGPGSKPYR